MSQSTLRRSVSSRLLDGLGVIIAILLAFGIQAWWDGSRERDRVASLLSALEVEWGSELDKLDVTIERLEINHTAMVASVAAHRGSPGVTADSAVALLRRHIWVVYKPSLGALDALAATDLDKVPSGELRAAIASWPSVLEESGPQEAQLREIGLRDLRAAFARIADSMQEPWSDEYDEAFVPFGVPTRGLALAAIQDPEVAVLYRHISTLLFSYRQRLSDIRGVLQDNLALMGNR